MSIQITNEEEAEVTVTFTTKAGAPAKVDGAPIWTSSDETIATVIAAADGMSAVIRSVDGADGEAELDLTADVNLGEGIEELAINTTVIVRGAKAGVATFSEPTVRPKT